MKLYEITESMKVIENMLDEGIPVEELQDTLDEINLDFETKASNCLYAVANMNAEIEGCKAEITRLTERKKVKEQQVARLKEYLLFNMQEMKKSKVENGVMTASIRKGTPKLSIVDEIAIPIDYKKITAITAIDKRALLKACKELEEGESIDGVELVQGENTLTIK